MGFFSIYNLFLKKFEFVLIASFTIPLKIKHKQHSTTSRLLPLKHFTNTFTNIYSYDDNITLDYIKNAEIKATLDCIKNTET